MRSGITNLFMSIFKVVQQGDRHVTDTTSIMSGLENGEGGLQALLQSFTMIIFSEIGDKTFLIAAILAMRHARLLVFAGAFGSLAVMSVLSAAMGHILPTLIPRSWTQLAASVLFLSFGAKMLLEARQMKSGNEKIQEEMREAEEEIEGDDAVHDTLPSAVLHEHDVITPLEDMERGGGGHHHQTDAQQGQSRPPPSLKSGGSWIADGARNFCSLFLGPVFVQAFVLTFLGEWGDRSQIATIALGAAHVSFLLIKKGLCAYKDLLFIFPECLSCDSGYSRWSWMLYSVSCCWREIFIN